MEPVGHWLEADGATKAATGTTACRTDAPTPTLPILEVNGTYPHSTTVDLKSIIRTDGTLVRVDPFVLPTRQRTAAL